MNQNLFAKVLYNLLQDEKNNSMGLDFYDLSANHGPMETGRGKD
jgi:hypothetical protein